MVTVLTVAKYLLLSREMAIKHLTSSGINYSVSRSTRLFLFFLTGGVILLMTLSTISKVGTWSFRQNLPKNGTLKISGHCGIPGADMKPDLENVRSETNRFQQTTVFCWPQKGGIWTRDDCDPVELDFLNVSPSENATSQRYSEGEDEFCLRLYHIGGRHYEYERVYVLDSMNRRYNDGRESYYGWPGAVPADGVWAIWLTPFEIRKLDAQQIRNVSNMAERCEAIERFGGRFYPDWNEMQQHVNTFSVETRRLLDEAEQRRKDEINYDPPGNRIYPASSNQGGLV